MEISISFKNEHLASTEDTMVSIVMRDIPYSSLHRLAKELPEVVARSYSELGSVIGTAEDMHDLTRDLIYKDGFYTPEH